MKAFTVIETLVAISILTVAIAGPLTIAQRSLQSALFARDQITALYLAQEGLDLIRAYRDRNALIVLRGTPTGWLAGLEACSGASCTIDPSTAAVVGCAAGVCPALKYDSTRNLYQYATGPNSRFTRNIQVTVVDSSSALVESTVSFSTGAVPRSVVARTLITSWYNRYAP